MATSGSNQKTKIHTSLKIQFQVGSFLYKIAKFSKNITPLQPPPLSTPATWHLGPKSKIHSQHSVCLIKSFPNGMTWPGSIKNWKVITFLAKGLAPTYNPWKFHSNWSNCWNVNQQFNYHGITLTTWPRVTQGGLRSKNKRKFNFGRGAFYKELPNSQKNCPPWCPHPHNPVTSPWPKNQKSALSWLFGSTTAFQNGMTPPGSTNDYRPAPLQVKGQGAGQCLPGGTGWEYYPPKSYCRPT